MVRRAKRYSDDTQDINFDTVDSYTTKETPEQSLLNTIINDGEDVAREKFGDDKVDRALIRRGQSRSYNPIS